MAGKKQKTAAELRSEAKDLLEQASELAKDEVKELVHELVAGFQKIKKAIEEHELSFDLDDYFDDMEEDDVGKAEGPKKKKATKKDLEEIRFLISGSETETVPFVAPTVARKRQSWQPKQKAQIVNEYESAPEGTKAAVLRAHGVKGNPIANWKDNKDVKMAMQHIKEKKK